ncbi:MAG: hypothetical protein AAF568_08895 [Pseudomonadota bacterium]
MPKIEFLWERHAPGVIGFGISWTNNLGLVLTLGRRSLVIREAEEG